MMEQLGLLSAGSSIVFLCLSSDSPIEFFINCALANPFCSHVDLFV